MVATIRRRQVLVSGGITIAGAALPLHRPVAATSVTTALQWIIVDAVLPQLTYQPKAPVLKLGADIVKYTSFATFSGNPVAGPAGYAMYDNEARINPPWPTPANEQANPPKYMRCFGQLGHAGNGPQVHQLLHREEAWHVIVRIGSSAGNRIGEICPKI